MKNILLILLLLAATSQAFAWNDTTAIPQGRKLFHDKIKVEQNLIDRSDGKQDKLFHFNNNDEINLRITDVLYRKVDDLRFWVEKNNDIPTSNDKIRYLRYIENLLKSFRIASRARDISPVEFPSLFDHFDKVFKKDIAGEGMLPQVNKMSYPVARLITNLFDDNRDYPASKNIVYLKYTKLNPDKILQSIRPFVNEPFADSLIIVASERNPVQLYSYAQSYTSPEGKLIHRSSNSMVTAVAKLSQTPNALFYFPFLDNILSGKVSIDSIRQFVGDGERGYDSVGYFKMLVQTEIEYFRRISSPKKDTPIAMFGANGLRDVLSRKAIQHFITPINELHDQSNLAVRMRAIDPLSPQELYFMIVMGENDIYTSSYKHSFNRMLQKMGSKPRGDSLLQTVSFDYFKKFIKMAANYNKLDTFLKSMPQARSQVLMKAFVANLDKTGNLEDAVDVADSYSSISDRKLLKTIFSYVKENEQQNVQSNNTRGRIIYNLLRNIFVSADSSGKIDLTATLGIPSIYEIDNKNLRDEKGNVVQQVFFYGDEDGKMFFTPFVNSYSSKDWKVEWKKEWVEIRSLKGNVWIYANKPLNNDANLDDSAQVHLNKYLENIGVQPSVVVHRGHSYWLPRTVSRMPSNAKIVLLGSCGGYKNLSGILEVSPDAHIISTKEIGKGDINQPITNYLNQAFIAGNPIVWKNMWASLGKVFMNDPNKEVRESWEDYIPPYKNLGAIFIKAYNKKIEQNTAPL